MWQMQPVSLVAFKILAVACHFAGRIGLTHARQRPEVHLHSPLISELVQHLRGRRLARHAPAIARPWHVAHQVGRIGIFQICGFGVIHALEHTSCDGQREASPGVYSRLIFSRTAVRSTLAAASADTLSCGLRSMTTLSIWPVKRKGTS